MERKNIHTNKQEQQTFAAHYELWFSRGGTAQSFWACGTRNRWVFSFTTGRFNPGKTNWI